MEMSFKEHKGTVTCVRVTKNDEEALSASVDGSCIIWNLRRGVRGNALFASTQFRCVCARVGARWRAFGVPTFSSLGRGGCAVTG